MYVFPFWVNIQGEPPRSVNGAERRLRDVGRLVSAAQDANETPPWSLAWGGHVIGGYAIRRCAR